MKYYSAISRHLVLGIVCLAVPFYLSGQSLRFSQIATDEGNSLGAVRIVFQDRTGFIWLGGKNGLNRYDGYKLTEFKKEASKPNALSSNDIKCIAEDRDGILWIATWEGGISLFDPRTETFSRFGHSDTSRVRLVSDYIECILIDSRNNVWIGSGDGLNYYDRARHTITRFAHDPTRNTTLSASSISTLYEDRDKTIWVGTANGLNRYDPATNTFERITQQQGYTKPGFYNSIKFIFEDSRRTLWVGSYSGGLQRFERHSGTCIRVREKELGSISLLSMAEDDDGTLWIGTENNGLIRYNPTKNTLNMLQSAGADKTGVGGSTVSCVLKDQRGNMWLGTQNKGALLAAPANGKFNHYRHQPGENSLSHNIVNVLFEDSRNLLWIGTDGGGLDRLDRSRQHFTNFRQGRGGNGSLAGNYVLTLAEDRRTALWIGTWGNGVTVLDPVTLHTRHYQHRADNPGSIGSNYAFSIYRDRSDRIWIGTYGEGLDLYHPDTDTFSHYRHAAKTPNSLSSNYILTVTGSRSGDLLIGTEGGGLNIFNTDSGKITVYKHSDKGNSLSNNGVSAIWEDSGGQIWIGTNYGLNRLDPKTGRFRCWFTENGLPSDVITGLLGDGQGNLWINTTRGISRYDPAQDEFENFSPADGLQGNEFKYARCLSRDGRMYLGGFNGFNEFYPAKTRTLPENHPIVLTGFKVFNREVPVTADGLLKKSIHTVGHVVLSPHESVLTFEFAALDFLKRGKIRYAVQLEGFDQSWQQIGTQNNITYTNLDPGDYTLRVRSITEKGVLSEQEASLAITVLPPYWKTWWFRLLVLVAVAGGVFYLFHRRIRLVRKQNRMLEEIVANRTRQLRNANHDLEVSNQTKDRFFSILAHDLKNPVAAVAGISEALKARLPYLSENEIDRYIDDIQKSAGSVQQLLTNLLDWARAQSEHLVRNPGELNVYELLLRNHALVEQQMKSKGIYFKLESNPLHRIWADEQMIDTVVRNLLSNCIKFTPAYGKITLASATTGDTLTLTFTDSGIGMSARQMKDLFSLRNQRLSTGTEGEQGTGLGMLIVKEFLEANNGRISVESEPNQGTRFTVTLPVAPSGKGEREAGDLPGAIEFPVDLHQELLPLSEDKIDKLRGRKILIVDDNREIRRFLTLLLSDIFQVEEASNGEEGIRKAAVWQPDLIVTDLLMPVMNGLEFCRKCKESNLTSHIPIVLLTSQTAEESQLNGYQAGADAYLMKPVRQPLLYQVIYNFLRNQELVRRKFDQSEEVFPADVEMNMLDKEFLDDVIAFVEANLSDPHLDHRRIGMHTNMSRTVLYAKFKSLTGQGVHDFIKSIRLKKGLKLLQEGRLNINQVAFEIGFNTPSYFSKSFLKQYGMSPTEYLSKARSNRLIV